MEKNILILLNSTFCRRQNVKLITPFGTEENFSSGKFPREGRETRVFNSKKCILLIHNSRLSLIK